MLAEVDMEQQLKMMKQQSVEKPKICEKQESIVQSNIFQPVNDGGKENEKATKNVSIKEADKD